MQTPNQGDHAYDLLFKTVANLEPFVSNFQAPKWGDHFWDLLYKLNANLGNFNGGSSGDSAQVVATPSGISDFSGLPGGVAPTSGVYFAPRDASTVWTIASGDAQWTVIDKNNP